MALTRKFLEALQIPENAVQAIIDEHMTTVSGIKAEWENKFNQEKAKADTIPDLQKKLQNAEGKTYEELYNAEKAAHDKLKADIAGKEARTAKEAAVKSYYEGKKITGTNLNIALRGTNLDKIELDDKGAIKDTKDLDALVAGDFSTLVSKTSKVIDSGAHLGEGGKPANEYSLRGSLREKYNK